MWNQVGWGPMYGWWFMPVFGLICMGIFLFVILRIFNREGGCGGLYSHRQFQNGNVQDELLNEVKALRREVKKLREQGMEVKEATGDDRQRNGD